MVIDGFKEVPVLELSLKPLLQAVRGPGWRGVVAHTDGPSHIV